MMVIYLLRVLPLVHLFGFVAIYNYEGHGVDLIFLVVSAVSIAADHVLVKQVGVWVLTGAGCLGGKVGWQVHCAAVWVPT